MLGRPDRSKRYEIGIKALSIIINKLPGTKLYILSKIKSNYIKELKQLANNLNISNNIIFNDLTNEIEKYYLNTSIFLLTSKYEGAPMVLFEAKLYGIPNIITGLEYLNIASNGTLICDKINDINCVANYILKILMDEKFKYEQSKLSFNSLKYLIPDKYKLRNILEYNL